MHKILKPVKKLSLLFFVFLMFSLTAYGSESRESHSDGNGNREYYSDGSLKSIGDTSKTGEKQNRWQYFYNNGVKMSEGEFLNGKKYGKWTYWSKEGRVLATKDFSDGVENSTVKKEASPETKTRSASESKKSEPSVENRSGFAATMEEWKALKARGQQMPEVATMEEWKALKARKQQMPEVEVPTETSTEETHSKAVEPAPEAEQKDEIVQTAPVQEIEAQPIAEITVPAENEVEPAKKQAPVVRKKPVASGGKFWRN